MGLGLTPKLLEAVLLHSGPVRPWQQKHNFYNQLEYLHGFHTAVDSDAQKLDFCQTLESIYYDHVAPTGKGWRTIRLFKMIQKRQTNLVITVAIIINIWIYLHINT